MVENALSGDAVQISRAFEITVIEKSDFTKVNDIAAVIDVRELVACCHKHDTVPHTFTKIS